MGFNNRRRGPRGIPGQSMGMGRVAALEAKFASGTASTTLNMLLGGTVTLTVTLNKTMPTDHFTAWANITSSSGLFGSVTISEVRATSPTTVDVVLTAGGVITGKTVVVNVGAMAI